AYPSAVFVDAKGNIFVADQYNHRIQKWAPGAVEGITVAGGNGYGSAANQFKYPGGVFVDPRGDIFVSDGGNNRIQKFVSLPVAKAGNDTTITLPRYDLNLDGSASFDPNGTILSYKWSKISGPSQYRI